MMSFAPEYKALKAGAILGPSEAVASGQVKVAALTDPIVAAMNAAIETKITRKDSLTVIGLSIGRPVIPGQDDHRRRERVIVKPGRA
jgi:hypothetical protein